MVIWVAIWTMATIGGAVMLAFVALLTWWSYEAGVWWLVLPFIGLMGTLAILSAQKKRKDEDDEDAEGEGLTDMSSFELEFHR